MNDNQTLREEKLILKISEMCPYEGPIGMSDVISLMSHPDVIELTKDYLESKGEDFHSPQLGLATTKQLLEELKTRAEIGGYLNEYYSKEIFAGNREIGDMLECLIFHADENDYSGYRTVDS